MLWLKALHLIFMVTWFAGLFYLPRLFVYHAMSDDTISKERFKVMERKLFIMATLGLAGTLIFGIWMLADYAWALYGHSGWLHIKLTLIVLMIAYHGYCAKCLQTFKHDRNQQSHIFYRWVNEVPVLFLVSIVLLAVIKPF